MKIYGNLLSQSEVQKTLQIPFRVMALVGPAHLGKRSYLESELQQQIHDEDILIVDLSMDGVREAISFAQSAPILSSYRVILIDGAEELSDGAKDAYLKLCEEPPSGCRICLVLEDDKLLPESLQSRIQYRIWWHPLSSQEMQEFANSIDSDVNTQALALCAGRPGLYELFTKDDDFISLSLSIQAVLNSQDLLFTSIPPLIKDLKSGASLEREAIAFIVAQSSKSAIRDSSKRVLVHNLIQFASNLIKYPSINADIHFQRELLGSLL